MLQRLWFLLAVLGLVGVVAGWSLADDVIDDITSERNSDRAVMVTIKSFGLVCCLGGQPQSIVDGGKTQVESFYWAFRPDAHLDDTQVAEERKRFDNIWASLMQISREYEVNSVQFVGCDTIGTAQCLDLYFESVTTKGPVIFRMSVVFASGADSRCRIFNIDTCTGWDKVKQAAQHIQHPASQAKILTVALNPLADAANHTSTRPDP